MNFPAVEKWPGKYKFTVHCNSKKQTFSSQLNTLFVAMQTKFAVEFDIADDDRMTPNHQMSVRTVVSYAEPADRETFGPVQPCACNVHVKDRSVCIHTVHCTFFAAFRWPYSTFPWLVG